MQQGGVTHAMLAKCEVSVWVADRNVSRAEPERLSPLFRAGIDDLPELGAVLDLLHLVVRPAIAADPVLHRVGVIGHQVRGTLGAGDLDAESEGLVVISKVETD